MSEFSLKVLLILWKKIEKSELTQN